MGGGGVVGRTRVGKELGGQELVIWGGGGEELRTTGYLLGQELERQERWIRVGNQEGGTEA